MIILFLTLSNTSTPFLGKSEAQIDIPKKTIIVTPKPGTFNTWWHMGSSSGNQAMQIVGDFRVTNITKYHIFLCGAEMKKSKLIGHVLVKDSESPYSGFYGIPPAGITDFHFHFFVIPPFKKQGETFITDIAIIDQFRNKHWIKGISFVYR